VVNLGLAGAEFSESLAKFRAGLSGNDDLGRRSERDGGYFVNSDGASSFLESVGAEDFLGKCDKAGFRCLGRRWCTIGEFPEEASLGLRCWGLRVRLL